MNIPASVILEKQLPPLAHAVLFDDGLGTIDVWAIAATLNQRPGWKADVLTGGYAAWHALQNAPDTAASGLHLERTQQIGYDNLNQLTEPVVLLDMRPAPTKVAASVQTTAASASDPLRDFCGKRATAVIAQTCRNCASAISRPTNSRPLVPICQRSNQSPQAR